MQRLQPFAMPLDGASLIEASAGTGKTYSITSLYLRLLLERQWPVDHILVVTFTKAATEELRERIRGRIRQALAILDGELKASESDTELANWLNQRAQPEDERRLRVALASMDSAAVFTIHGFCQRVLIEHAFDTGMAFEMEFIDNQDELCLQAAEDFWRRFFSDTQLPVSVVDVLIKEYASPENLLAQISQRLSDDLRLLPDTPEFSELSENLVQAVAKLETAHQAVREDWHREAQAVIDFLREAPDNGLYKGSYKPAQVDIMIEQASLLAASPRPLFKPVDKLQRLTASGMKLKAGFAPPDLAFWASCEAYLQHLPPVQALVQDLCRSFLAQAREQLRQGLRQRKQASRKLYFDDLLICLDEALQGVGGQKLARRLSQQYPFALIDEFQDTDATQYRIFRAIYGEQKEAGGLCLIGDPKQAIYGFRGGDIYTYLKAASDARQRYFLDTNWRSSSRLVEAINTLFNSNEQPFLEPGISYQTVQASPLADEKPLLIDGQAPIPLQFWKLVTHDGSIKVDEAKAEAALAVAHHINYLLKPGRSQLGARPLEAADIALLVRTHRDASLLQQILRQQGIHSVTLSQQSVFASEEATALLHLLQALLECEDEALLRHALSSRLLGYTAEQILALIEDDDAWEQVQQRFCDYRESWREHGFIVAFQRLFRTEGLASQLLGLPDGERRLTNLLQLVELLQQASSSHPGMEELLRWFLDEMQLAGQHEAALLRLESDENLVKIVTMHASKGLEYPLVYIPFPWAEGSGRSNLPWFYHDDQGRACLYLGGGDDELRDYARLRMAHESLAERLRLLYVALTRAARLCVLTWGRVNNADKSALAWLLFPGEGTQSSMKDLSDEQMFQRMQALAGQAPQAIAVCDLPTAADVVGQPRKSPAALQPRLFQATIERNWRVNSYSGLVRGVASEPADYDAGGAVAPVSVGDDPVQHLPAGAGFGLVVHELLEQQDFTTLDANAICQQIQRLALKYAVPELRSDPNPAVLANMLARVLDTELPGVKLKLSALPRSRRSDEMEFHFATTTIDRHGLKRLLNGFPDWRGAADGLRFSSFQGLMHGYIDLVFEHQGRYWLADYKSSRLDDYQPEGLDETMAAHHYPLQALIYGLALHRHLRQCLPDYAPQRHLGGVFYLFIRGMRPGSGAGIWYRPLDSRLLHALDEFFGKPGSKV